MTRPTTDPTWATDANYAAGGDPWSGQPTKVAPSGGVIAKGQIPETGFDTQIWNWLLANHGDWLVYLRELLTGNGFHFRDDFLYKNTGIWTEAVGGTNTVTCVSGNGAPMVGALRLFANSANADYYGSLSIPFGAKDFMFSTKVGVTTATADVFTVQLLSATSSHNLSWKHSTATSGHWLIQVGTGADIDTGIVAASGMFKLTIQRKNGRVYFLIDDAPIHDEAYTANVTDSSIFIGGTPSTGWEYIVDFADLVIDP